MSKKYTLPEISNIIQEKGYKLVSQEYQNAHQKLEIECPRHGIFLMRFCSLKNSDQNCPKCSHRSIKYTTEEVRQIIHEKGFKLITQDYIKNNQKLEIECPRHGIFKKTLDSFKQSVLGCIKCSEQSRLEKRKNNYRDINHYIQEEGFSLLSKELEYKNNKTKLEINCPRHGIFNIKYNDFQQGHRCSKCAFEKNSIKQKNDIQEIRNWINNNTNYILISNIYKNNKTKLKLECPNHGIFKINWNHLSNDHKCPNCATKVSKPQEEILSYIRSIYNDKININDRTELDGKEIDIFMPKLNFGIEFDGLYWHSEKCKSNAKSENKKKIQIIQQKNINILMIYEDEWSNPIKKELIKSMIKHRLGLFGKKIRASNLEIKKLTKNNEFKDFFENYHLDGHVNASFSYGLFLNDELISCMSFRKSFTDKCWEIARFATKSDYRVHGNAGKIIKQFKKDYQDKLITFSNNRLSLGNTYKNLGFKEITQTTDPSYYYTDFKTRLWRFKCKRINDPVILSKYPTEKDQAEGGVFSQKHLGHSKPLYKIYDYGHKKWEL